MPETHLASGELSPLCYCAVGVAEAAWLALALASGLAEGSAAEASPSEIGRAHV